MISILHFLFKTIKNTVIQYKMSFFFSFLLIKSIFQIHNDDPWKFLLLHFLEFSSI